MSQPQIVTFAVVKKRMGAQRRTRYHHDASTVVNAVCEKEYLRMKQH